MASCERAEAAVVVSRLVLQMCGLPSGRKGLDPAGKPARSHP